LSHSVGGGQIVARSSCGRRFEFSEVGRIRAAFPWLYKYLYTVGPEYATLPLVGDSSPQNVVFDGDSRDIIRSFPKDIRSDLGADLDRVQNGEKPLDSAPMAPVLPGVFELRGDDQSFWYRVLYKQIEGVVYVLHCFKKKTNKTSLNDIKIARERLSRLKGRLAEEKKKN
jgi:phage-related protein